MASAKIMVYAGSLNFVLSSIAWRIGWATGWGDYWSFGCGWIFVSAMIIAGVLDHWSSAFEVSERTIIPWMWLAAFANALLWYFMAAGMAAIRN